MIKNLLSKICGFKLKEVEKEKERLEAIYNSLPDGVYTTDLNRKIQSFNPGGELITGFKKDQIIGKRCTDIFAHEDEKGSLLCGENCPLDLAISTNKIIPPRRAYLKTATGKRVPVVIATAPVKDKNGKVVGAAEFFRDITNEVKIEQLKSDFLAVVSHELRIPLSAIKESMNLVLEGVTGTINDSQKNLLTVAKNEIERLNRIISEVLDVSRMEAGRLKLKRARLDLAELVRSIEFAYRPLADKKSVSLFVELAPALPDAIADSDRVRQVFSNLLSNALKFTSQGGSVKIKCSAHGDNLIECSIEDTGCGMPSDSLGKLFGKFEQLGVEEDKRRGGAGLGLYISKTIVEAMGGTIWAQSQEGKGSTFSFTLPAYKEGMDFYLELDASLKEAKHTQKTAAVILLEANLKDAELENLIHIIENIIRGPNDKVLRDKSDIYIVLDDTNEQGALSVKNRVKAQVQKSSFDSRNIINKFGVAIYPTQALTLEELLDKAKKQTGAF